MKPAVHVQQHGAITVVTLNRPDVRNAVDADTARQLVEVFVAFDAVSGAAVAGGMELPQALHQGWEREKF